MLQYAVDEANDKILQDTDMKLAIEIETIAFGREYAVSKRVCNLLEVMASHDIACLYGNQLNSKTIFFC